jgi:hypothetical protein
VLILYNQDVILAKHYLNDHDAGIYGGLNKIGNPVLSDPERQPGPLPRVVEAVAQSASGRILLSSAGILALLGGARCSSSPWRPGSWSGSCSVELQRRHPARVPRGVIGLALSLDNLLCSSSWPFMTVSSSRYSRSASC